MMLLIKTALKLQMVILIGYWRDSFIYLLYMDIVVTNFMLCGEYESETEGKTLFPLIPKRIIFGGEKTSSLHPVILHLLINLLEKFTYLFHKFRTSGNPISSHGFAGPLK